MNIVYNIGKKLMEKFGNIRQTEYRVALRFMGSGKKVLDVGCGTGTFLEFYRNDGDACGVDLNPENISYCQEKGLNAQVGSAFDLDFPDESFDVVHASHLLHIFPSDQAVQCLRECCRVLKPKGSLVISTHNSFPRFFRHPENARPYPPDSLYRLFGIIGRRQSATSPMYPGLPIMEQCGIWLRRPALINFESSTNVFITRVGSVLNAIKYSFLLRKYWSCNSYIVNLVKLR